MTLSSSSLNYIDSLILYSWTGTVNSPATVTYSYDTSQTGPLTELLSKQDFSSADQTWVDAALQQWVNVANIHFTHVSAGHTASIILGEGILQGSGIPGETFVKPADDSPNGLSHADSYVVDTYALFNQGTPGFETVMHEIGHALGLKHPGDYNSTGDPNPGPYLDAHDNTDATIMSYHDGTYTKPYSGGLDASTPMIYDIAAMQYLYGANFSYNNTGTSYGFTGDAKALTVWDGGGADTFDASDKSTNVLLDLREGFDASGNQYVTLQ